MKLTLTVQNMDRLDNGLPARIELPDRGAVIGRSPTVTWCLPDTSNHISSRHCEIIFRDGQYIVNDTSTNGTFVNGRQVTEPTPLSSGNLLTIGSYQISVVIEGMAPASQAHTAQSPSGWAGWDTPGSAPAASPSASDDWGPAAAVGLSAGWDPAPSAPASSEPDVWGVTPQAPPPSPPLSASPAGAWAVAAPPPPAASPWSSAVPDAVNAPPPSGGDIWGKMTDDYVVDWARGGFGQQRPPEPTAADVLGFGSGPVTEGKATDVLGLAADSNNAFSAGAPAPQVAGVNFTPAPAWDRPAEAPAPAPPPPAADSWGPSEAAPVQTWGAPPPQARETTRPPQVGAPQPQPAPVQAPPPIQRAPVQPAAPALSGFVNQLGINRADLKPSDGEVLDASGMLLRRLVAGLVVMLEARARAKSQMGAQGTALQFDGNNPMKFARTPEQALVQLLNPPERGFMTTERAVEDAFLDLNSHQVATLKAMQGALKATLDRFSPSSIRERAESKGLMAKIFPDARDAALWKAYEREFSGVVQGSDEAFMDVFAKEFRKAYEELTARKGM